LTEIAMLAAMGLAGSLHCAGMCGGLALVARRLPAYLAGKTFTYVFLGALAGAFGRFVVPLTGARFLAFAAAAMLAAMGLESLGVLQMPQAGSAWLGRALGHLRGESLLFGAATGLLPCPMVYAFAAVAGASASPLKGASVMLVLAATTAIPLTICALFGRKLSLRVRYLPGIAMLVMAGVSLYRGLGGRCH
jgi:hypothetical protein